MLLEALEARRLLASDYQNPVDPCDVNDDSVLTPLDALIVINRLSRFDSDLPELRPGGTPEYFWDVDSDNHVTANDALIVIHQLDTPRPNGFDATHDSGASSILYVSGHKHGSVGDVAFEREDILAFDMGTETWSVAFDGSDVGLHTADVNAFHFLSDNELLIAIDRGSSLNLPGLGRVNVSQSDILKFSATSLGTETSGTFETYFDGSDVELNHSKGRCMGCVGLIR